MYDFNTAGEQRTFDVIPDRTVAILQLNIRPGNVGEGGLLKRSKSGEAEALDCELIVVEGPYTKRKFWDFMTLSGTTDGHATAADISQRKLRAILESARGIRPTDVSEAAKKARVAELHEFDGIRFMARIGVEPAKGDYRAKNFVAEVITPDRKEWHPIQQVEQPSRAAGKSTNTVTPIVKPNWAK